MRKLIPFLAIATLILIFACNVRQAKQDPPMTSSNDDYTAAWRTIDSLEQKGLPKSALDAVTKLYDRAKKEQNTPQIVKTLIFRSKYTRQLEEEGWVQAIAELRKELAKSDFPVRPILQSMLGELYQSYLDDNYWRFQNRTEIEDYNPDDIRTWSSSQLIERSNELYRASVENKGTANIPIEKFKAITTEGKHDEGLRPTLYDLLAHRAIEHFKNDRSYLTEPAYKFYIDQEEAFADAGFFVNAEFTTRDTSSNKYHTLLLFQQLIAQHLSDSDPKALVDIDLDRLKFVYDQAVLENKAGAYQSALERLQRRYDNQEVWAEISYALAQFYFDRGGRYNADNPLEEGKWDYKKAFDLAETIIDKYPQSFAASQAKNLKINILSQQLQVLAEEVNVPNRPVLARINYKNVPKIFVKVAPFEQSQREEYNNLKHDERLAFLNRLRPLKQWEYQLPDEGDYRSHSTEIKIDPLASGTYMLMVADNERFTDEKHAVNFCVIQVSGINYWSRAGTKSFTEFFVVDRLTGHPLEGVRGEFFQQQFNANSRKYEDVKWKEAFTNEEGYLRMVIPYQNSVRVRWSKGDDELYLDDRLYNYQYEDDNGKELSTAEFFLDRAIYRPGQTIYFKAIILQKNTKGIPRVLPKKKVAVVFRDVNNQEIAKQQFTSNEYGTINGSFTAPVAGLLGQMTLTIDGLGAQAFRVEEYKRPKFAVEFQPIEKGYRLNEEVLVPGQAQGFAGNNIDNATVRYRVVRETVYPFWSFWRPYPPVSETMEIAQGELVTDREGKFTIPFVALPDRSESKEQKPRYHFRVYADVTDVSGETQSAETTVFAGYVALDLDVSIGEQLNKDSLNEFNIQTRNLNGQFEPASGSVTIEALQVPATAYVQRFWMKPDTQMMSREIFQQHFPHYSYQDEDLVQNWPVQKVVFTSNFNTATTTTVNLKDAKLSSGQYVIKINTSDRFGEKVEFKKFFQVYDLRSNKIPSNDMDWFYTQNKSYQPGEIVRFYKGTATEGIKVLFEIERADEIAERRWVDISGLKEFTIPVKETDRGNFHYHLSFTRYNRNYTQSNTVIVPWSNKELSLEYSSFRDKLKPGQQEEWRIKISGPKKEKIAAEMVAAMYDASLDQFIGHSWKQPLYPVNYSHRRMRDHGMGICQSNYFADQWNPNPGYDFRRYRMLNWFDFNLYGNTGVVMRSRALENVEAVMAPAPQALDQAADGIAIEAMQTKTAAGQDQDAAGGDTDLSQVKARTNLKETVFFYPELRTDEEGNVLIKFTMNEALTKWKFLGFAHTKDLEYAFTEREIITQKELMVQPNPPRFVREGDEINLTAKVSNLTDKEMDGVAELKLFDGLTMQPVDDLLGNTSARLNFSAPAGQSAGLSWKLNIPKGKLMALTHRVVAKAGNYADGEESTLPVVTNRMLVTETLPLAVRGNQQKNFNFVSLQDAGKSSSLQHHRLTLEFTSNPVWYAVQALPYIMEYPYECTEQVFSRLYANSLATEVANAHPKIRRVFESWRQAGSEALESNLSKNEELKTVILEETPWVLQAQSEALQKQNIALLFDLNRMANEQEIAIAKLSERQLSNGGFGWFPGDRDNWYITQYILEGFGHLQALGVQSMLKDQRVQQMQEKALGFIDQRLVEHYEELQERVKRNKGKLEDDHLDAIALHYLYTQSFFDTRTPVNKKLTAARDYYLRQAEKYWLSRNLYQQGMIAMALHRNQRPAVVKDILASLKERALHHEELGMYWKFDRGFYWFQHPIETQSLMIELFAEVAQDRKAVDDLRIWLLKNKQTNNWRTTKATASAIYALLTDGRGEQALQASWIMEEQSIDLQFGGKKLDQSRLQKEPGTGYFKMSWRADEIDPKMAQIKVSNPNNNIAWGALYWQYFEDLDQIKTFEETPLTLRKQLFKQTPSDTGPKLQALSSGAGLNPGDKLTVRIELRVDRDMEYVHMKDMRASGFEPVNVLSSYKYSGGLGYYESTKDAATNFFFSYLPKGTYVFEYPLRVVHEGDFSNGVTTIQCMYAPEFTSHSEGIRVKVKGESS